MRKLLLVGSVAAAGIAAAVFLSVINWSSNGPDPATALARSQAAEDEVLAQLTEGKALHQKILVYTRHGPAAEMIRQRSTEWYLPERHISELWLLAGAAGEIVSVRGWVKSESGETLQDITTVGSEVVTRDISSGAEVRTPLKGLSADAVAEGAATRTRELLQATRAGEAVIAGNGQVAGRTTLRIDQETALSDPIVGEGFSLPYMDDLKPVKLVKRTELDEQSFQVLRYSLITTGSLGDEQLVEEWQRVEFEVVSPSTVPGDGLELR